MGSCNCAAFFRREMVHALIFFNEKCWPFFGGAYTLLAVKRVVPLTPIRAKWHPEAKLWQGASEGLPKPTSTAIEIEKY